jgi:hypothetical protein
VLSIADGNHGIDRRRFLTIGSLGGLSLPLLSGPLSVGTRGIAGDALDARSGAVTGKSVIFLFQQGGPSQFETFDPKVDGPAESRSVNGTIPTSIPGVRFGSTMSRLAKLAHKLTIVRSFKTGNAGHNIQPIVGPDSLEANIGTHYSRFVGTTHVTTGMPTNAILFPRSVDPAAPRPESRGNLSSTGPYGSGFAPFVPGKGGKLQEDMTLSLPRDRLDDRRHLLRELDRLNRRVDASGKFEGLDDLQGQAYELLLGGGVSKALDLSGEDSRTLASYETRQFARPGQWDKVSRGRKGYYSAQASTLGRLLLLARRLCETGCGFVTIHAGYAGVWDMHADGNNLNMVDGMEAVGRSFDHAVAAFIEDVEARGLRDKILLVACGEMGRTPRLNQRGGRNHWSRLAPLLLYGGGIDGGRVIGRSDRSGGEPATEVFTPKHLISTILNTVFDAGQLRLEAAVPPELTQLISHAPIAGLV